MEINISALKEVNMWPVSGSVATHGTNAGTDTFNAAKRAAMDVCVLDTLEKRESYREHLKNSGMDETENLNALELNAILIQEVSIELRENGLDSLEDLRGCDDGEIDRLFYGVDGGYYFYAGS